MRFLFTLILWLALAASPALAEKRVALVIGNGAYKHAPALANPRNDAEGMAAALKRLRFEVIAGLDLDEAGTRRLLREFAEKLEGLGKDDVAVFFYAGHGLQVNGKNYLVPVDAKLAKERDLDFQAVAFDFLQSLMEKTAQTNIVILDSCRDNPLARTLARGMGVRSGGIGRGLAEMRGINDTLIVYATNPGNVALDGAGKHSPFTEALLKHVEQPGLEVRHMISQVRAAVIAATKGQQVPWEAASLTRQVYFAPAAAPTPAAPTPAAPTPPGADGEIVFWQSIKDSKNAADYKAYLDKYPNGTFAALARIRLAELEKASVVTPAPETPPAPEKPVPKPASPALQKRISTFDVDVFRPGDYVETFTNVPSARECQQRCLNHPQCVAWNWRHETQEIGPRFCSLHRNVRNTFRNNQKVTSGTIRTVPAAAPAQPASPRPSSAEGMFQELMRKSQAREIGWTICARVPLDNRATMDRKYEGAKAGDILVFRTGAPQQCWASQVLSDAVENGKRCLRMQSYGCYPAAPCRAAIVVRCKLASGRWEMK